MIGLVILAAALFQSVAIDHFGKKKRAEGREYFRGLDVTREDLDDRLG